MSSKLSADILIIDDEKHVVEYVSELITYAGHTVVGRLDSGLGVISKIEETNPDLILLDVLMPGETGDDLVAKIIKHFPKQHIVMLTSKNTEDTVIKCIKNGAKGYILKSQGSQYISDKIEEIWLDISNQDLG